MSISSQLPDLLRNSEELAARASANLGVTALFPRYKNLTKIEKALWEKLIATRQDKYLTDAIRQIFTDLDGLEGIQRLGEDSLWLLFPT